jgi:sister-chromatid-cohesion protein PDS5
MARRSGRAAAAAAATAAAVEEVEQQEEESQGEPHTDLQFDEPLTWRAPRVIPVAELLRRLQTLSKELGTMEQGVPDRDSFTKVAKELAFPGLLHHKDRGVKAWLACCLVDMLKLCAPDAPYTGPQLKVNSDVSGQS